eukprot:4064673-Prorocentrum_lima.AAC.1
MLSVTNGRNETLITTDIANAFLNALVTKDKTILVAVPYIGNTWNCRQGQCGRFAGQYMGSRKAP